MDDVRWLADPSVLDDLTNPVLVAGFTGWNDAGDAASTALRTLVEAHQAVPVAEIDPEPFTDFATTRPHVSLTADHQRRIIWPTCGLWCASMPGADVLILLGPEPALRWRRFCEVVLELGERAGAPFAITVGALLADVPHTRPVHLIGTATDDALIERFELERSRYEGPTGIVGVLQAAFVDAGIPAASLWAAVPGYAAQLPSPRAAMSLVERTCSMIGTPAPLSALSEQAQAYDARVDQLIADDDDLATYVARLEAMIDEHDGDEGTGGTDGADDPLGMGDADSLMSEVEQFLRDQGDDAG